MAVFTLHNSSGDYMHQRSTSKQKMIDACDKMTGSAKVCEEYLAPSPFDNSKMTKHAREVHRNY